MAKNCMCEGADTLLFPCSGSSDVGELSDRMARKMAKRGAGRMFCLAGIGAHIDGMIESAKSTQKIIAIDGCPVSCAKKTLEHAGFLPECFNLKELGFEKGKTKITEELAEKAIALVLGGKE